MAAIGSLSRISCNNHFDIGHNGLFTRPAVGLGSHYRSHDCSSADAIKGLSSTETITRQSTGLALYSEMVLFLLHQAMEHTGGDVSSWRTTTLRPFLRLAGFIDYFISSTKRPVFFIRVCVHTVKSMIAA